MGTFPESVSVGNADPYPFHSEGNVISVKRNHWIQVARNGNAIQGVELINGHTIQSNRANTGRRFETGTIKQRDSYGYGIEYIPDAVWIVGTFGMRARSQSTQEYTNYLRAEVMKVTEWMRHMG